VRRDCNRYIAGKWLFDFLHSGSRTKNSPGTLETLAPEVAATCKNASLASATVVAIPDPRFPRLKPDASPYLVSADGSYQQVRGGDLGVSPPGIHARGIAALLPDYGPHKVKVQLSHWSQLFALPPATQVARSSEDRKRKAR
jgi:hypothetical protein